MQIYLIRHGITEPNKLLRYAGRIDVPLCEEGIAQAKALGGVRSVKNVYVTPLIRTQQTAEILFPEAKQTVVEALREMDFGDFENRSAADMENDAAYRAWVDGNCLAPCPNGESMESFAARVSEGFARCIAAHDQSKPAVFVIHGGTIMALMHCFARPKVEYFNVHAKNCQGFRCTLSAGEDGLPLTLTEITTFERFPD